MHILNQVFPAMNMAEFYKRVPKSVFMSQTWLRPIARDKNLDDVISRMINIFEFDIRDLMGLPDEDELLVRLKVTSTAVASAFVLLGIRPSNVTWELKNESKEIEISLKNEYYSRDTVVGNVRYDREGGIRISLDASSSPGTSYLITRVLDFFLDRTELCYYLDYGFRENEYGVNLFDEEAMNHQIRIMNTGIKAMSKKAAEHYDKNTSDERILH